MKPNLKFKKSVFIFLLIAVGAIAASVAYWVPQLQKETTTKKENESEAEMGDAAKQNFFMTQDPALKYPPTERMAAVRALYDKRQLSKNPSSGVTWDERGPGNLGGRTRAIMFDPMIANKVWAGGVSGGLWWNDDITQAIPVWNKVNDFWDNLAITAIAHHPTNTDWYYVGTGEGYLNKDAVRGGGMWNSIDGGVSWNPMPSTTGPDFDYIQDIVVKANGEIFVATLNGGVQRSTDGGLNWSRVLGVGAPATYNLAAQSFGPPVANNSVADMEMGADGTIYAAMGIGESQGVFRTANGTYWERLSGGNGFDSPGDYERVEIACAPSAANIIYAITTEKILSTLHGATRNAYVSNDYGVNWNPINHLTNIYAWYNLTLSVDPIDPNTVYVNDSYDLYRSVNGGSSWSIISTRLPQMPPLGYVHGDQQAIVFNPGSPSEMLIATDGGLFYSTNINTTYPVYDYKNGSQGDGYGTSQFYACAMDPSPGSNYFLGGTQDNGVQIFDPGSSGISDASTWEHISDGGYCFIDLDPVNSDAYIASKQTNYFYRSITGITGPYVNAITTGGGRFITAADYDYRYHVLYTGKGAPFIEMVKDVTSTPIQGLISVTGMTTLPSCIKVFQGAFPGSTLFIGTGPDDLGNGGGQLFKVINANTSPSSTPITPPIPGANGVNISCIETGATENDLLVTYSNYGVISVWETHNGGTTWKNKEGNLDAVDMPIRWALYNPNDRREVFLATESGVWSTTNIDLQNPVWGPTDGPIARTRVDMLRYRSSDKMVLVATHGRGLWSTMFFNHPVANFSFPSAGACSGTTLIQFTNLSTSSVPMTWVWNFGDGSSSILEHPSHSFSSPGTYQVTLTVSNQYGSGTVTHEVTVGPWVKKVGTDLNSDYGGDVLVYSNGDLLITGSFIGTLTLGTMSVTSGNGTGTTPDIYVARLDQSGNPQWIQVLDMTINGVILPQANSISLDASGNILVAASGKFNIYIAKLDPGGNPIWNRSFRQQTWQGINKGVTGAYDICTDANGDVYVAGSMGGGIYFDGNIMTDVTYQRGVDWYLAKFIGTNGKFDWVRHSSGRGSGIVWSGGNVVITGLERLSNILFRAYDASGGQAWNRSQGLGTFYSAGSDICADPSGNLYLTGQFYDLAKFGPTTGSNYINYSSAGQGDIFVARYSSAGFLDWVNQYGGVKDDQGNAIFAESSDLFVTGYFSGSVTFPTISVIANNGLTDIFTMGLSTNGSQFNWATRYGGVDVNDAGNGIFSDANSIYEIGNFTDYADFGSNSLQTPATYYGAYLKKICKSDPSQRTSDFTTFNSDENISIRVAPNPSTGHVTLDLSNMPSETFTLKLFNIHGALCMSQKYMVAVYTGIPLDLTKLPKGVYLLNVESEGKSSAARVVVY